jgi:hypothetical protein
MFWDTKDSEALCPKCHRVTRPAFIAALVRLTEAVTTAGMRSERLAFELLFIALALSDRNSRHGCSRATFLEMAGIVYDKSRVALAAGPKS